MKWLPFFILLTLFACRDEKKQDPAEPPKPGSGRAVSYNSTVNMPYRTEEDSGYFKGYIPGKLERLERVDSSALFGFLATIITKKDIQLLNNETLSHSVFINQRTKTRYDTLKNDDCIITSIYYFDEKKTQQIKINGLAIKGYTGPENTLVSDDDIDFDGSSFRYFSFKGEFYYYIQAGSFDSGGTSMGNVTYHLVWNKKNNWLNCFQTCRFDYMLLGDVNGDQQLDYLDFDNSDFCTTVPYSGKVFIQLYSSNEKGQFVLQKDAGKKPYFIEGLTGAVKDDRSQDSFSIRKYNWPKRLQ